jgi:hypothetical protein
MKITFVDSGRVIQQIVNSNNQLTTSQANLSNPLPLSANTTKEKKEPISNANFIENHITNCVNFHLEHNSFPKKTPNNIDIVFTEKHKLQQLWGKLIGRQKAAHVDTTNFDPNHQVISISTDLANFQQFDTVKTDSKVAYKQYNDFTNRLKVEINKFSSNDETLAHARYIQVIFLHELAHTILNKGFQGTIFLDHFKKDTTTSDPVAQFSTNVAEAFCDGFAGIFMTKQILEEERKNDTSHQHFESEYEFSSGIIGAMANARKSTLDLTPPGSEVIYTKGFIYPYDFSPFLTDIKTHTESLFSLTPDKILNKLLKMAFEHTKTINNKLMIENDLWKPQFTETLTKYLESTEFQTTQTNINTLLDNYFLKPSQKQLTLKNLDKHQKNKM